MKTQDWTKTTEELIEPFLKAMTTPKAGQVYQMLGLKMRSALSRLPQEATEDRQIVQSIFCKAFIGVAQKGGFPERLLSTAEVLMGSLVACPPKKTNNRIDPLFVGND